LYVPENLKPIDLNNLDGPSIESPGVELMEVPCYLQKMVMLTALNYMQTEILFKKMLKILN